MKFMLNAKCRQMDPGKFHTENLTPGRERIESETLCAGCPVYAECAQDALQPMSVTQLLEFHYPGFKDDCEDWVSVSGVVRAGECL